MSLKKNAVSYIMWMIILLFTGAAVSFLGMVTANMLNKDNYIIAAVFVAVFLGLLFLLYFLTGMIVRMRKPATPSAAMVKASPIIEAVAVFLFLTAGVIIRAYLLPMAGEEAAYYEVSRVTDQSGILVQSVQGSVYYYCMLLHGLFLLVGNHWIAGIWLQIALQMIGAVLIYFAVKRLTDRWPAIFVLIFIMFAPSCIEAGITYSPQMMYFCIFALALLLVADYIHRSGEEETYPVLTWCYTVLLGLVIGICSYIDITGCLLFLPVLCLPMVNRVPGRSILWFLRQLLIIGLAVGAFCLMLMIDSMLSGSSLLRVFNAWFVTYCSVSFSFETITGQIHADLFILIVFICLGAFSFWRRKGEERFTPVVLLVVGMSALHFCGITTDNMDGSYLLYVLLSALAAVSLTELFHSESKTVEVQKPEVKVEIVDLEERPRFIENPLPVPKKHIRKIMDYAITPEDTKMDYDVQVADTDDYDI